MSRDFRVNVGPYAVVNKIPQVLVDTRRACSVPTCPSVTGPFARYYIAPLQNFCGECGAPIQETLREVVRWPEPNVDDEWTLLATVEEGFLFVPNHAGPRKFVFLEEYGDDALAIEPSDIASDLEWFENHYEATIRILRGRGHTVRLAWGVVGGSL